jgi:Heparinase II/III-like protein
VVARGDQELLIDPGTYSYMEPEWRGYFRGSSAHNTVRIDRRDQAVAAGPFRWTAKPEVKLLRFISDAGMERAAAVCRYQGFAHTRTVDFTEEELVIVDQIEGPPGEHEIEQFWHFAQNPRELAPGRWAIDGIAEFAAEGGALGEGWRSRCFGSKEPCQVIIVRQCTSLPLTITARLRFK